MKEVLQMGSVVDGNTRDTALSSFGRSWVGGEEKLDQ